MNVDFFVIFLFSPDFVNLLENITPLPSDPSCTFDLNVLKLVVFHTCNPLNLYSELCRISTIRHLLAVDYKNICVRLCPL